MNHLPTATNGGILLVVIIGLCAVAVFSRTAPCPFESPARTEQLDGPRALARMAAMSGLTLAVAIVFAATVWGPA